MLEFNKLYDNLSEEEIVFYSLKYNCYNYKITYNKTAQTHSINYDEPDSWPAFFIIQICNGSHNENSQRQAGIFTSKTKINLVYTSQ